jgi:AraC-like DNA-binding protein
MRCFEIDLGKMLRIALWNETAYSAPNRHPTRITPSAIIYFITEGSLKLESGGEEREYFAGDVAIFRKGVFQRPLGESSVRYFYVHFDNDILTEYMLDDEQYAEALLSLKQQRLKLAPVREDLIYDSIRILLKDHFTLSREMLDKISASLDEITKLLERRTPQNLLRASYTLADILYSLEGCGNAEGNAHREHSRTFDAVTKTAKLIEKNYTSDISIESIAASLYLNPDYLGRIFKEHIGCSMTKYKNRLRIAAAKRMLMSTANSIDEIAFATGFSDRFYFSRIFKATEGVTPSEYRRRAYGIGNQDRED